MHRSYFLRSVCIILITFLLTGCWDKVELEDRGFVVSIGLDKTKDTENGNYSVSMAIPDVSALSEKSSDPEENKAMKTSQGETVSEAMRRIDSYSSEKIYFGHTKTVVISEEILSDAELFKQALDALERNREIGRNILMLGTSGKAEEILSAKTSGEPMSGMYIDSFFRNNRKLSSDTFRKDLGGLIRDLRETGNAVLPKIELEDKELKIGGAGLIKDSKLVGWLDDEGIRGYLWVCGDAVGTQVIAQYEGINIPFHVDEMKSRVSFLEEDGGLVVIVATHVSGEIEEYIFNDKTFFDDNKLSELQMLLEEAIAQEILTTAESFHGEYEVDGFGLKKRLRKQNYDLYLSYEEGFSQNLRNIKIVPQVSVVIGDR